MKIKTHSRFQDWWNTLPIQDDLEHRMAILMQSIVLGFIVILLISILVNQFISSEITAESKLRGLISNSIALLIFVALFMLIRWGYYRSSFVILLFIFLALPSITILVTTNLQQASFVLVLYTLSVVVAGLGLNRGALVFVYGLSSGIIILSAILDTSENPSNRIINTTIAGNFVLLSGLIALFINQFSGAL